MIQFIDRRILAGCEHGGRPLQRSRKNTWMVVRRVLTELKAVLAGAILEVFSVRPTASMAAFNAEIVPARSFGGRCFPSIFEI